MKGCGCGWMVPELERPGPAVSYRSVIDLQLRIDREFHIASVERHLTS